MNFLLGISLYLFFASFVYTVVGVFYVCGNPQGWYLRGELIQSNTFVGFRSESSYSLGPACYRTQGRLWRIQKHPSGWHTQRENLDVQVCLVPFLTIHFRTWRPTAT